MTTRVAKKLRGRLAEKRAGLVVMVVDDDPGILGVMIRLALRGGHTPLPCAGLDDVRRFLSVGARPDVLVTDIVLGEETGVSASKLVGDVPTIYVSGYDNIRPPHRGEVLPKPFEAGEFLEAIERSRRSPATSVGRA